VDALSYKTKYANNETSEKKWLVVDADGQSLGDRNTPALGYGHLTPDFALNKQGEHVGGQFWDGRAINLQAQAGGPILNAAEMALQNKHQLLERIQANADYVTRFRALFGASVLTSPDEMFDATTLALSQFEHSNLFSPFDSKYDRYLAGDYQLSKEEDLGMTIFFSQQFSNCNQCHQLRKRPGAEQETFSDYRYHNIGVPTNVALRAANDLSDAYVDQGLLANPAVADTVHRGKFKTPSLRNVAITGPYMHNGVFKDLKTVVAFYNKYNSKSPERQINPETGASWAAPETSDNLALDLLTEGPAMDDRRMDALVAFLKTLTDKRYEHLLKTPDD